MTRQDGTFAQAFAREEAISGFHIGLILTGQRNALGCSFGELLQYQATVFPSPLVLERTPHQLGLLPRLR